MDYPDVHRRSAADSDRARPPRPSRTCDPRSGAAAHASMPVEAGAAGSARRRSATAHVAALWAGACLTLGMSVDLARAEWRVWTTVETRHVLREDPAETGVAVRVAAARNECRGFQILMRSDEPVGGVNVVPRDLTGPDGRVWQAANARLYRQHQLNITDASSRNDQFRPGWYPDPLIPFVDPRTGEPLSGARLSAVPFDLPADQTHGFWIDLTVPPESVPGEYRGVWQITAADGRQVDVPLTLRIWDFALPRVSTLITALGSPAERMRGYYRTRAEQNKEAEPADWQAVGEQCAQLLSEHRINATPPDRLAPRAQPDGSYRVPDELIDNVRAFVDRYHVNALRIDSPSRVIKDPEADRARLHAWLRAWDEAAARLDRPAVVLYIYLKDEPNDADAYHYVQRWGRAIREARSVVKVTVVEQTKTQNPEWGDLYGAVDIWCPLFPLHDPATAAERMALGETVWTYTALCQRERTPWWQIDFPLLNYRVPAWIAWRDRMTGILYWGGMSFWQQVEDPWTDPKTLDRRVGSKGALYNGEGTLVYPGRAVGYDGIAPSLRLKALRDAIQDYEYMAILDRAGKRDQAEKIVLPLAKSWFEWNEDPTVYEQARTQLTEAILRSAAAGD